MAPFQEPSYGVEWHTYLQRTIVGNEEAHIDAIRLLSDVSDHDMRLPPKFPPPAYTPPPTINEGTPNTARGGHGQYANNNPFSGLSDSDDEPEIASRTPAPATATATAPAPVSRVDTIKARWQVRYFLFRAYCGKAECYQKLAGNTIRKDPVGAAELWKTTYRTINTLPESLGEMMTLYYVFSEDRNFEAILDEDLHCIPALGELYKGYEIQLDHTDRNRNLAIQFLEAILTKTRADYDQRRRSRDEVKASIGEEKWTNNPNPKMDYAEYMFKLMQTIQQHEDAIAIMRDLAFSGRPKAIINAPQDS